MALICIWRRRNILFLGLDLRCAMMDGYTRYYGLYNGAVLRPVLGRIFSNHRRRSMRWLSLPLNFQALSEDFPLEMCNCNRRDVYCLV